MTSRYRWRQGDQTYQFRSLADLMAKATPERSGDALAGVSADSETERVAAQMTLAELPLKAFLQQTVIPYEDDEVTRLIIDTHDMEAFDPISHLTVGDFRNWLLSEKADTDTLYKIRLGLTPEMVAAVSKIMRNQDLIAISRKMPCKKTAFRNTIGLPGKLSTRLQPNHPTDSLDGIAATIFDGLMYGNGDAVIGINPATDNVPQTIRLLGMLDEVIQHYQIPTQSCVLTHVTNTIEAIEQGAPVDLVFQSIGGTEGTNQAFGVNLGILKEAHEAALSLNRGTVGSNCMYFETGQGTALSANAYFGVDQQTCEARAYAVARHFDPLFSEYRCRLYWPRILIRWKTNYTCRFRDHFCAKMLGLPMGCDVCYTNHAYADQNDMDNLLTLLGVAGCSFIMGIPGSDDIMLNYQTTSFHDALYARKVLGLKPSPEFEQWLIKMHIFDDIDNLVLTQGIAKPFSASIPTLSKDKTNGQ